MENQISIQIGGLKLAATMHYPEADNGEINREGKYPIVVICHGFTGDRIGVDRLFVRAARQFSSVGFMVLRFDYSGSGESVGDYGATGLDSLIDQTRVVIDYVLSIDCVDPDRVILLGHSLGGATAILTAARDRRVKTVVLWSPVAYPFNDIVRITGKKVYEDCLSEGTAEYRGYTFRPHFFNSLSEHQPLHDALKFTGDVLLVHGTDDDEIPVDYSFLLQKALWTRSYGQCDKEIVLHADHSFTSPGSATQAIRRTSDWLLHLEKQKSQWLDWSI